MHLRCIIARLLINIALTTLPLARLDLLGLWDVEYFAWHCFDILGRIHRPTVHHQRWLQCLESRGQPFANCNASRGTFRRNRFYSVVSDFGTNFINALRRVVKLSVKINGVGPILTTTFRTVSRIVIRQSCVTRVGTFGRWICLTDRAYRDIYIGYTNLLIVFGFHRVITMRYDTFQPFCRFAKYWYLTSFHSTTYSDRCAAATVVRYNRSEKAHTHEDVIVTRQISRT